MTVQRHRKRSGEHHQNKNRNHQAQEGDCANFRPPHRCSVQIAVKQTDNRSKHSRCSQGELSVCSQQAA